MVTAVSISGVRTILGLMTFGPDVSKGARVTSLDEYNAVLDYFQSCGFNEVDTARLYTGGKQEDFTAQAQWKQRHLKLATKAWPYFPRDHEPQTLKKTFETSLNALQTDYVDIYYLHAPDRTVPFKDTLQALNELHQQGKFGQLGLSNYSAFEVAEIVMTCQANGWVRPTIYQGIYNALTRTIETELIPCCRRYGLDIVIFNPLAGGLLAGKYKSSEVPTEGRYSDAIGGLGAAYRERYFKYANSEALSIIEPVAAKHNFPLTEIALRWCVHHSKLDIARSNDGIIVGVSSLAQLKTNLADLEKGPLPEEVVKALDDAWSCCKADTAPYWHGDFVYGYDTKEALFTSQQIGAQ